jgi:PAS domain S-box-containing protein
MQTNNPADAQDDRRLAALERYRVLDTPRESGFDDLALLASEICGTPIAVVNLIGSGRQWFKAEVGLGVDETPLDTSFCATAILEEDFLIVPDATKDPRFACNPLVTGEPGLRFYAGALLKTPEDVAIGTLCVLDYEPRILSETQQRALRRLAGQIMAQLELRLLLLDRQAANQEMERRIEASIQERSLAQVERDRAWAQSQDLLAVVAQSGEFIAVNSQWRSHLGWDEQDLIGRLFADFTHPEDLEGTLAAFAGIFETPLVTPYEYRLRHKDGGFRWFAWTASFADGQVYASGRATTAQHEQAEALASAEDALRQSQKLEAIGQLTGGVAHDFNNLLTVIRGSVDLLRRDDLSKAKRVRYIDAIGDTADRAAKLTSQLLAFARRQALLPELFDAGASLVAAASLLQTMTGSRVTLDLQVPDEPYFILADRSQFDTAIVNMGINARDAMQGDGRLTISTRAVSSIPPIMGQSAIGGEYISVTIADTGEGIPSDRLSRIFEPFFTTKEVGLGTGLGLSQVIGFAKQSGGDIRVDSVVGEGTEFTLYLPRSQDGPKLVREDNENRARILGEGACVLVVEDNEQVGEFATAALKELGYSTELATDGFKALAALDARPGRFHIVFSDVVMPGMTGLELGRAVRDRHPDVAFVLTSGYSHVLAQDDRHGFELLHKPYSVEQLSRVLRRVVFSCANQRPVVSRHPRVS